MFPDTVERAAERFPIMLQSVEGCGGRVHTRGVVTLNIGRLNLSPQDEASPH